MTKALLLVESEPASTQLKGKVMQWSTLTLTSRARSRRTG